MKIVKILTSFWILGALALILFVVANAGVPLGWDPLSYRHFMTFMQIYGDINFSDIAFHQFQFEAFFGTVSYYLGTHISVDVFLTFGYVLLTLFLSLIVFIAGKRRGIYTLASYFGAVLILFSAVRYQVFALGLGKEMIAVTLFLLAILYYRNVALFIILSAACVGIHKLTGFMLFLSCIALFFIDGRTWKQKTYLFYGVLLGIGTYIATFDRHILPLLNGTFGDYIGISGGSGTLFPRGHFWLFELVMIVTLSITLLIRTFSHKKIALPGIYQIMFLTILSLLLVRVIGHTRVGAFFDIFLILCVATSAVQIFPKKILIVLALLQMGVWGYMSTLYIGHSPTLRRTEVANILELQSYVPQDALLVSLSPKYQAWLFGYSGFSAQSLYFGIFERYFSVSERKNLKNSPEKLCEMISSREKDIYLYVGLGESSLFPHSASCLKRVKKFEDGAILYIAPYK